ncbi:MAG: GAF domain-containing protein [Betaproteobacteria bacterium]
MSTTPAVRELDSPGWRLAAGALTCHAYQSALALVIQRHFQCSTVGLWRIVGARGERTLHSIGRYGTTGEPLPATAALAEAQLGLYFNVLNARGAYACDDALLDLRIDPLGIRCLRRDAPRAFLDALVAINGHAFGVLSCCQDFGSRRWQVDEETTLKRLGARVALHLTRAVPPVIDSDCGTGA